MTPEDSKPNDEQEANSDAIDPQAAPFEPSYQPGTVPAITVPDLAQDAVGVSAQELAEVAIPTLTEQVLPAPDQPSEPAESVAELSTVDGDVEVPPQETAAQADTWQEQMQVRMSKLSGEIHSLNDRLDRLEQRAKTKA